METYKYICITKLYDDQYTSEFVPYSTHTYNQRSFSFTRRKWGVNNGLCTCDSVRKNVYSKMYILLHSVIPRNDIMHWYESLCVLLNFFVVVVAGVFVHCLFDCLPYLSKAIFLVGIFLFVLFAPLHHKYKSILFAKFFSLFSERKIYIIECVCVCVLAVANLRLSKFMF